MFTRAKRYCYNVQVYFLDAAYWWEALPTPTILWWRVKYGTSFEKCPYGSYVAKPCDPSVSAIHPRTVEINSTMGPQQHCGEQPGHQQYQSSSHFRPFGWSSSCSPYGVVGFLGEGPCRFGKVVVAVFHVSMYGLRVPNGLCFY